jgi:hypothetical protein
MKYSKIASAENYDMLILFVYSMQMMSGTKYILYVIEISFLIEIFDEYPCV